MNALFHAHSGFRYLVLLAAIVALGWFLAGTLRGSPFGRSARAMLATFLGLLDLQVVVGLALLLGGRRPPGLYGHLALMLAAAAALHLAAAIRRRRPQPGGYGIPLAGVATSLALIVLGILALGIDLV